jgi:RHS repeat-associated protein
MEQASSAFSTGVPVLAAIPQLAGNSRQGFGLVDETMRWASGWVISSNTLGLSTSLYDSDAGSRSTGKERDTESGNDYFEARYYASSMGRMLSPDPVFISADRIADPQGLNLYAYARNNPLTITDPTGLDFYQTCTHTKDNGDTCQQVQNGSSKVWVQGTSDSNGFTANRIANDADGNLVDTAHGNAAVSGSFDENGVHLNGAQGQFIDGSAQTNVNGSGVFSGIQGQFVSDCGGSCQGRAELVGSDQALSAMEGALNRQGGLTTALDLLSGAHNSGTQWKDSNGYIHVILNGDGTLNAGKTEMHFEGHPTGVDVTKFVLHMVDTIRDATSGRAAAEKSRVLP